MAAEVPERFERDMACDAREWQRLLRQALAGLAWQCEAAAASITLEQGHLRMRWHALPTRRIAQLDLPMLRVHFAFVGVGAAERGRFMRHFDMHTHRGGG
ncbi:MAG: hypothetical protein Q4G70_09865 [Pseudomonadota bacterium]|nr:hypothetical protein [Pseudomonadota bacterium]